MDVRPPAPRPDRSRLEPRRLAEAGAGPVRLQDRRGRDHRPDRPAGRDPGGRFGLARLPRPPARPRLEGRPRRRRRRPRLARRQGRGQARRRPAEGRRPGHPGRRGAARSPPGEVRRGAGRPRPGPGGEAGGRPGDPRPLEPRPAPARPAAHRPRRAGLAGQGRRLGHRPGRPGVARRPGQVEGRRGPAQGRRRRPGRRRPAQRPRRREAIRGGRRGDAPARREGRRPQDQARPRADLRRPAVRQRGRPRRRPAGRRPGRLLDQAELPPGDRLRRVSRRQAQPPDHQRSLERGPLQRGDVHQDQRHRPGRAWELPRLLPRAVVRLFPGRGQGLRLGRGEQEARGIRHRQPDGPADRVAGQGPGPRRQGRPEGLRRRLLPLRRRPLPGPSGEPVLAASGVGRPPGEALALLHRRGRGASDAGPERPLPRVRPHARPARPLRPPREPRHGRLGGLVQHVATAEPDGPAALRRLGQGESSAGSSRR